MLYADRGEDIWGDDYSCSRSLVRCRKCGALCLEMVHNKYESPSFGDNYDTVYVPVENPEEAKKIAFYRSGRRYIREISNEFKGDSYWSDRAVSSEEI